MRIYFPNIDAYMICVQKHPDFSWSVQLLGAENVEADTELDGWIRVPVDDVSPEFTLSWSRPENTVFPCQMFELTDGLLRRRKVVGVIFDSDFTVRSVADFLVVGRLPESKFHSRWQEIVRDDETRRLSQVLFLENLVYCLK